MRIAHVTDYYLPRLGGVEMHIRDLAVRQLAAGHDVEVITSSARPPEERGKPEGPSGAREDRPSGGEEAEEGLEQYLRVLRLTEATGFPSVLNPVAFRDVRRAIRRGGYDVVHVHVGPATPLAWTAICLAREVPTVVTMHSLVSYMQIPFKLMDAAWRWSAQPAVWTAVSEVAAEPVRRLVGNAPVHLLPNGIDAAAWRVEPEPRKDDDVLVVAVGRLAARKRPMQLLRMLRRAHERLGPDTRLRVVIAGEGAQRSKMERYLHRHGMTGWVELPGRLSRSEIRSLFARADFFVAPATLESFGIAALEARSAGLPVVARSQGGIGEFVTHGQEGLLVESDAAMVDAIVALARDSVEREAIAVRNRTMLPIVAWPDVLRQNEAMYELAIERLNPSQSRKTARRRPRRRVGGSRAVG
jgi:glycosyltransferase involved in cell wall biosynthesis